MAHGDSDSASTDEAEEVARDHLGSLGPRCLKLERIKEDRRAVTGPRPPTPYPADTTRLRGRGLASTVSPITVNSTGSSQCSSEAPDPFQKLFELLADIEQLTSELVANVLQQSLRTGDSLRDYIPSMKAIESSIAATVRKVHAKKAVYEQQLYEECKGKVREQLLADISASLLLASE